MKHVVTFHFNHASDLTNTVEHTVEADSTEAAIFAIMNRKERYYIFESDDEIYYIHLDQLTYINAYETDDDSEADRVIF